MKTRNFVLLSSLLMAACIIVGFFLEPSLRAGPEGIVLYLVFYFLAVVPLGVILKKRNYPNYWFALIPLLNWWAVIDFVGKPPVWVVFLFVPLLNIVIMLILMAGFLYKIDYHPAFLLLLLVPVVGSLFWVYLAFALESA